MITKKPKREKRWQTILFSLFLAIVIFGVIGFLIFSNWKINKQRIELAERIENIKKEITALEQKKQGLEAAASESFKESYLEEVAREQLNLKKPGEEVVAILSPEEEEKQEIKEEKSLWQRILEKIGF